MQKRTQEAHAEGTVVRKLWIGEAARYRDHLLRLDAESRHSRFGGGVSDDFIIAYVKTTFGLGSVVHGFFADGVLRGAAELRPLGRAFASEAEAAFSIETDWQSHGVGSMLLDRTLLAARNRGIKTLHMACLANNLRMQELARKFTAELSFDFGDVVGEVAAARPTPLSVLRELVADNCGFATAVLDVQSRLLKSPAPAHSPR
ncbi:MAG: GNAT family N-acetyltransferase [Alphaproteobacteria bacterium]|nr:GNAT family N-acetyltransferase [Alphaproteobacteria bacterium]